MKLYFVRHGSTKINQAACFNGSRSDSPLTADGKQAAAALGEELQQIEFAHCYSSPQQRALTTAKLVMEQNTATVSPQLTIIPQLREMDLGQWDGTPVSQHQHEAVFFNYYHHPAQFAAEKIGAESYSALVRRGQLALKKIIFANQRQLATANLLVVSHGLLLTTLLKSLQKVPLDDFRQDGLIPTASVTIMQTFDGRNFETLKWGAAAV
jgi:probable phosphoglycerate mutase